MTLNLLKKRVDELWDKYKDAPEPVLVTFSTPILHNGPDEWACSEDIYQVEERRYRSYTSGTDVIGLNIELIAD